MSGVNGLLLRVICMLHLWQGYLYWKRADTETLILHVYQNNHVQLILQVPYTIG